MIPIPRVREVTVNGIEWEAIDAADLRSYLADKARRLDRAGNHEEAGGVRMVLDDLDHVIEELA